MRRSKDEILFGILKSCAAEGLSINQLIAVQNLSYKLLRSSLDQLTLSGLVVIANDQGRKLVNTTKEGLDALSHYRKAASLIRATRQKTKV